MIRKLNIWDNEIDNNRITDGQLPPIHSVVINLTDSEWTEPRSIREMIRVPKGLEKFADPFETVIQLRFDEDAKRFVKK